MSASSAKASNIVPQIHLMVQTSAGVSLFNGPPPASSFYGTTSCTSPDVLEGRAAPTQPEPVTLEQFEWRSAESGWDQRLLFAPIYSPQGDMVCALHETSQMKPVSIYCAVTGRLMYALPADVQAEQVQFSPKGNFLVTWSRSAGSGGNSNLKVWYLNPQEGCTRLLGSFSQKTYKANVVQWTNDESYCCRIVSNEVNIYRTADLLQSLDSTNDWTVAAKVRLKGITAYAVAPVVTSDAKAEMFLSVVVFTPEAGGKPARATLFRYSCGGEGQSSPSCAAAEQVSTRTLFAANEAKLMWNVKATAVLVFSHADVAASSYYGATGLFLMQAVTDKRAGELSDCKVEQSKDGPVHAAAWSPTGDRLVGNKT